LRIHSIHLKNFRNFTDVKVAFGQRRNLIVGANAQGKTNLLEAIHILGVGRSHRDRRDANLVSFGETYYRLEGTFEHIGVMTRIEVAWSEEGKRIRINGKDARPTNLIGLVGVVNSSPDDIDLIKGSPGFRRTFLDMAISQTSKEYLSTLQRYVRAVAQRNRLLKAVRENRAEKSETEVWDRSVVELGSNIVKSRLAYLEAIRPGVEENFSMISGTKTGISLTYEPRGYRLDPGRDVKDGLEGALRVHRDLELTRGHTYFGPHVDDFRFFADGRDMRQFGSEGEQRTAVLALRCSEVCIMKDRLDRYPVVLLDDVFAELDRERSRALTALISEFDQIVLTSSGRGWLGDESVHLIPILEGRIDRGG
jgi:DNA replication and repair protein RecF